MIVLVSKRERRIQRVMTNKKLIFFILLAIVCIGLVIFYTAMQQKNMGLPKIKVGRKTVRVELARTSAEQERGLSNRDSLAKDTGMLFVFAEKKPVSFWMKDMRFPLDFVWMLDNKVVDLNENVKPPADPNNPGTTVITPKSDINYVLEVNAGFIKANGIKVDDTVEYSLGEWVQR